MTVESILDATTWAEQTRAQAGTSPLVLLSADTTILDDSHHRKTKKLSPIGNGKGRGYLSGP